MKRFHQQSISFIMTAIYLLITLSPFASLSFQSKPFFQVLSRECSGDCRLCGCSAERSASHACCCWQKKLAAAKNVKHCETPSASLTAPAAEGSCCSKSAQHADHADEESISAQADSASDSDTQSASISSSPCGSSKELTFFSNERGQHVPYLFLSGIPPQKSIQISFLQPERLASRNGEPPDPPPKLVTS